MAIYHLHCRIIGRASKRSVVAAAAYRAAQRLTDERTGRVHNFSRKPGVVFSAVLAPDVAPAWARDRGALWNAVEAREGRKDAQLARDVTLALPVELTTAARVRLLRRFVAQQWVAHGMIADVNLHEDHPGNPHAHVLLTLRGLDGGGFGAKNRRWNERAWLLRWREEWAAASNVALARAGHVQRIDARSFRAQGIALEPTLKLGAAAAEDRAGPGRDRPERRAEHDRIRRRNGAAILARPAAALRALTQQQATFTTTQLERFLRGKTADAAQFGACRAAVLADAELVLLRRDARGEAHMSSREMVRTECQLMAWADALAQADGSRRGRPTTFSIDSRQDLSLAQRRALGYLLHSPGRLLLLEGYAGSGKGHTLAVAHRVWLQRGHRVVGAALSGRAAEGLAQATGMAARSLAAWEHAWRRGTARLTARDVLVVDEAAMVGTRQLERVLRAAVGARATVMLMGDAQQLQAIDAGAPFRALCERLGQHTLDEVRRQQAPWQRAATRALARGQTWAALQRYRQASCLQQHATAAQAQAALLAAWHAARRAHPGGTQLLLAHRHCDVLALNQGARALLVADGTLRGGRAVTVRGGDRRMAPGDAVVFLRNDARLGVRNGTAGTVVRVARQALEVQLERPTGAAAPRRLWVPLDAYPHLDHGYAATVHRAQGMTVDRTFALVSQGWDRHATYVALTRHRVAAHVCWSQEAFPGGLGELVRRLSRSGRKDLAFDHLTGAQPQPASKNRAEAAAWSHLGSLPWCDRAPVVARLQAASRAAAQDVPAARARAPEDFLEAVPAVRQARLDWEAARARQAELQHLGQKHRAAHPWRALWGGSQPPGAFERAGRPLTFAQAVQWDAVQVAAAERALAQARGDPDLRAQAGVLAQAAEQRLAADARRMAQAEALGRHAAARAELYSRAMGAMVRAVQQVVRAVGHPLERGWQLGVERER